MNKLKYIYKKSVFNSSFIGLIINPFYIARRGIYILIKKYADYVAGNVLDVGCGDKPYMHLFNKAKEYDGLEIESSVHPSTKADFFYDGTHFPFPNNVYDTIITNQVLEHVFTPDEFLEEIYRVLKPGGSLILTVPFIWDEHEQPYDYARYSSFGLKSLLEKNGFDIIVQEKTSPNIATIFQILNTYIQKIISVFPKPVCIVLYCFTTFPLSLTGLLLGFILPNNKDLYLDNFVVAKRR